MSNEPEANLETGVDAGSDRNGDTDGEGVPIVEAASGTGVPIRGNDIDTDQIIPARYLKAITFDGLGEYAFYDQRYENGEETDHPFNDERYQGASVLVVNANFGCGSSREHAPQALDRWGIDAIVGESFAEIFAGNCLALGIPTVTAPVQDINQLQDHIEAYPETEIAVDIANETVSYGERLLEANVDTAQRTALLEGVWDTTELLKSNRTAIFETAQSLPYVEDSAIENAPGAPDGGSGSRGAGIEATDTTDAGSD
jgi:3-isopropylmalate/(R)-2-methylmalate dehydratase small subunit